MEENIKQRALEYHSSPRPGKTEVTPTKPYSSPGDLALAYSPGVAYPCLEITQSPHSVYDYTNKGNLVAVISNGTAVLGLGDIGPEAGKPVMEGKALLFKIFAGLDCFDIEVDAKDPERFIDTVKAIAPTFGGINLEDIKAPECFEIEQRLKAECNIPVMHDDQHGTAIISGAGLINALEIQGKNIEDIRLVVNGAGAAAISCTRLYIALGVRRDNIVMCDSRGVIRADRPDLTPQKLEFATSRDIHTLEEAMQGADVFLGLSVRDVVTADMLRSMADRPIVFALANPDPEIAYDTAIASRPDLIFATGRSDYPNQINNVLGFPYIFRGALDCGATTINEAMKLAAVRAIALLAKQPVPSVVNAAYGDADISFGPQYILPKPLDPRLLEVVAPAVARGAMESGVASRPITDWSAYDTRLHSLKGLDNKLLRQCTDMACACPRRVVFTEGNTDSMLLAAAASHRDGVCVPILLGNEEMIHKRAARLGVNLSDIRIINPRHDREEPRRKRYARLLADRRQRQGITYPEARELMYDRNYFGMMMVEQGEADAAIVGTYASGRIVRRIAAEVIGIKPGYSHFASVHIINTKRGDYFIADTSVNTVTDDSTLYDVARLTAGLVRSFNTEPVMALVSFSDFGSSQVEECLHSHTAVERLQRDYPGLAVDGEMQLNYALNSALRDHQYPFTRLLGRDVNTLIFPNLSSASTACRMMLEMGAVEAVGPIQIGLNRPVHFVNVDSPVRDIVNMATIATLDANLCSHDPA